MKLFPESAYTQLEFNKIKDLLANYCQTDHARTKAQELRIHTRKDFVETELRQTHEYRQLFVNNIYFPNDYVLNLAKELKLLSIPGAMLSGEEFLLVKKLAEIIEKIFRWFDAERKTAYGGLSKIISHTYYEKVIAEYEDFADRFPESTLLKEAQNYSNLSQNHIKEIKNEQITSSVK